MANKKTTKTKAQPVAPVQEEVVQEENYENDDTVTTPAEAYEVQQQAAEEAVIANPESDEISDEERQKIIDSNVGRYIYQQQAVLYTDGISGMADGNQPRAYQNSELRAGLHKKLRDEDFGPVQESNEAEEERIAAVNYEQ